MEDSREKMRIVGNRYAHLRELLNERYNKYWEYALTPEEALKVNAWHIKMTSYLRERMIKEMLRCEYGD